MYILLDMYHIFIIICCVSDMTELVIPIPTYHLDTTELYEQLSQKCGSVVEGIHTLGWCVVCSV